MDGPEGGDQSVRAAYYNNRSESTPKTDVSCSPAIYHQRLTVITCFLH